MSLSLGRLIRLINRNTTRKTYPQKNKINITIITAVEGAGAGAGALEEEEEEDVVLPR